MNEDKDILNETEPSVETPEQPESGTDNNDPMEKTRLLQQQLDEARNKYLYLFSDFENFRRNAARERMDLIQTAGRDILTALLPVLDDFDRAAKNGGLTEGVTLIQHKLSHIVQTKGLRALETKAGDSFDADRHEAVVEIPAPTEDLKGKVVDVIEQGYQLGDKIVRFAKVVVGK